jgi:hypothetical protein
VVTPLQAALFTVVATFLVIAAVAGKAILFWMQRKQIQDLTSILGRMEKSSVEIQGRMEKSTAEIQALLTAATEASKGLAGFSASLAESSQMQVIQLEAVAKSVTVLRRTLLTGQTDDEPYEERQVQNEMEVEQLIERGIPRGEAEKRVAEKDVWSKFQIGR